MDTKHFENEANKDVDVYSNGHDRVCLTVSLHFPGHPLAWTDHCTWMSLEMAEDTAKRLLQAVEHARAEAAKDAAKPAESEEQKPSEAA